MAKTEIDVQKLAEADEIISACPALRIQSQNVHINFGERFRIVNR
jgi:hypothetical protein